MPEISFEAWGSDLETVVDAEGLDRFPLLRICQGAPVAVAYAARHPERVTRLILYGGFARGRLVGDPHPRTRREAETLANLISLGWGTDNPAFAPALHAVRAFRLPATGAYCCHVRIP